MDATDADCGYMGVKSVCGLKDLLSIEGEATGFCRSAGDTEKEERDGVGEDIRGCCDCCCCCWLYMICVSHSSLPSNDSSRVCT